MTRVADSDVIRIVIADDHQMVRDGLIRLLESEPGFRVVGWAGDGFEAVERARELRPDVLLLDLMMPRAAGVDALRTLATEPWSTRTIVLTAGLDKEGLVTAVELGARGIILKESASTVLFDGIRAVMDGRFWLNNEHVADIVQAFRRQNRDRDASPTRNRFGLTRRELQVVAAAVAGESTKEISTRLSIAEPTVKHHLTSIFDKLGVFSRVELAVFAVNHGLIDENPLV